MLGYSRESSSFLLGVLRFDKRVIGGDGYRFSVIENKSVKFFEDVLVSDLNLLKLEDPNVLRTRLISQEPVDKVRKRIRAMFEGCSGVADDNAKRMKVESDSPGNAPIGVSGTQASEPKLVSEGVADGNVESSLDKPHEVIPKSDGASLDVIKEKPISLPIESNLEGVSTKVLSDSNKAVPVPAAPGSSGPGYGIDVSHLIDDGLNPFKFVNIKGVLVKKRLRPGRPAGLTKQPWWKQQGRKPKERQELPISANMIAEDDESDSEPEDDGLEDGPEVLSYTMLVARRRCRVLTAFVGLRLIALSDCNLRHFNAGVRYVKMSCSQGTKPFRVLSSILVSSVSN